MVSDIEIGWLAGVMDGEGTITITHQKENNTLHAAIFITNTDTALLNRAKDIIDRLGVVGARIHPHDNRYRKVRPATGFQQTRPCLRVYVGTCPGIRKLLRILKPQLTSKRLPAELMLEFAAGRGGSVRRRNNARDFEIAKALSAFNRGLVGSVETERAALANRGEMMSQSELYSDVERPAEMTGPTLLKKA